MCKVVLTRIECSKLNWAGSTVQLGKQCLQEGAGRLSRTFLETCRALLAFGGIPSCAASASVRFFVDKFIPFSKAVVDGCFLWYVHV